MLTELLITLFFCSMRKGITSEHQSLAVKIALLTKDYPPTYLEALYQLQLVGVSDGVQHELHVSGESAHAVERRDQRDGDGAVGGHLAAEEEVAR